MTKKNVTTNQLLDWENYDQQAKISPNTAASAIYKHARESVYQIKNWYWTSINAKKNTSLLTRALTFILLFVGTILPLINGPDSSADSLKEHVFHLQLGIVALAAAGLIQIADKVFGWSSGWVRYIGTVTLLESYSTRFEMDWSGFILSKNNALDANDVAQLFGMAKEFVEDSLKLQSDETDKWAIEFNNGVTVLADAIRLGRETNEKAVETTKSALSSPAQTGGIQVSITRATATDKIEISVDKQTPELIVGQSWAIPNIATGVHLIYVRNTTNEAKSIARALIVLPNAVTSETVTV